MELIASRLEAVRGSRVPGARLIERLVADRLCHPMEDSELEAIFRRIAEERGLPMPIPQYQIWREDGSFVAEVDFAYPKQRVAIELDSWTYHGGREPFEADRTKQNDLVDLGWVPLRFTKRELKMRADRVGSLVARHVSR